MKITSRPRRNRRSQSIRSLVQETLLSPGDLILPAFVTEGSKTRTAIKSMPGVERLSRDFLVDHAKKAFDQGVPAIALFPVIDQTLKDPHASESKNAEGLLQKTIRDLKKALPEMAIITDVAMDPYSSDGHDGFVRDGHILNDESLPILAEMAVAQARAGADIVAPSDMMDGRIGAIRRALDEAGFIDVAIMSYAAKYASSFYGPFREALDSAPKSGDKKTYQMNFANKREAVREALLDVQEGADMLMVKPGLAYLDVIQTLRAKVNLPIAAYQVSGEYAMIKAAQANGWIDGDYAMFETLMALKRAGSDMILTYFAVEMATQLNKGRFK
jgi:porphobilinogen synthase